MTMLYLSRLTLDRSAGAEALRPLLDPENPSQALDAHHRLLWSLFADDPGRRRDFLWRSETGGRFLALSARPPAASALFLPHEVKPFETAFSPGDRLLFVLRANATKDRAAVSRLAPEARRGASRRVDLVMDLLKDTPPGARAPERHRAAEAAARGWMERQGEAAGFVVESLTVEDYRVLTLPRPRGPAGRLGVLELSGALRLTRPEGFLEKLATGFGRARAFGCGLMLVRRG